jgi:hypothetical protein
LIKLAVKTTYGVEFTYSIFSLLDKVKNAVGKLLKLFDGVMILNS